MNRLLAPLAMAAVVGLLPAAVSGRPAPATPTPPPDADVLRQGGDTFADAVLIPTQPFTVDGSTAGYTDDYDEACPHEGSTSPDVVYRYTPAEPLLIDIDLLGSSYDTKVYVYGAGMELVACNDDHHPDYSSRIEALPVQPTVKYYIVVDGYGGDFGAYHLELVATPPYEVECWPGMEEEGEPPLQDGYTDTHNAGCSGPGGAADVQVLPYQGVCATSGWYDDTTDHDWYGGMVIPGPYGSFVVRCDAEQATRVTAYLGADCASLTEIGSAVFEESDDQWLEVGGAPGQEVWLHVQPASPHPPAGFSGHEYLYWVLADFPVEPPLTVQSRTWSAVKALYRP